MGFFYGSCGLGDGGPLAIVWHGARPLTVLALLSVLFSGEALPAVVVTTGRTVRPVVTLPVCCWCAQASERLPLGGARCEALHGACGPASGGPLASELQVSRSVTALALLSVLFSGAALPAVAVATGRTFGPVGMLFVSLGPVVCEL